jgi:hypothetical protein
MAGPIAILESGRATFRISRIGDSSDATDAVAIAKGMIIFRLNQPPRRTVRVIRRVRPFASAALRRTP